MSESNHNKFLSHLRDSHSAVNQVSEWFKNLGYDVNIPESKEAETHGDWKNNTDNGDLYIKQRIEVKCLSASFTCKDDWCFGDKFIVCAKHSYDRAKPKPYAYIILSSDRIHAAIVKCANKARWYVESRKDSRYDSVKQEFYMSPINDVSFIKITWKL